MAHKGATLVKVSNFSFVLEDRNQDLRGSDVYDREGQKIPELSLHARHLHLAE